MNKIETIIDEAYSLFNEKKYSEALEKIDAAEELVNNPEIQKDFSESDINETKASIHNFRGFNYLGLNQIEVAKENFEKSLELNPNSSQACAGIGEVFYLCRMENEAKVMFEWSLDHNPYNQFATSGLAKTNRSLGLPEAHNTLNLETTLKKKDNFFKAISEAYLLFNENKYKEALNKLNEMEKMFTQVFLSHDSATKISTLENFKGFNYLGLQEYETAKACFEKSLNLNPESSQACAGLGEILFIQGSDEEAKTMFEWAVKYNPKNEFAKAGLAKANSNLNLPADDNKRLEE